MWEVLPHATYSSDMSRPEFYLFPKLKEPMRGRFPSLEGLSTNSTWAIRHRNKSGVLNGITMLPKRWDSVIENQGDYIEGLYVYVYLGFKGASTSQAIGARNDDGWLWWPNDIRGPCGPKASWHSSYRWGKTPKNPHPGNLSRPGIEPVPAAWQARMLPLVPQRWTIEGLWTDNFKEIKVLLKKILYALFLKWPPNKKLHSPY